MDVSIEQDFDQRGINDRPRLFNKSNIIVALRFLSAILLILFFDLFLLTTHGEISMRDFSTRLSNFDEDGGYSKEGTRGDYTFGPYYDYRKGVYTLKIYGLAENSNTVLFLTSDYGHKILLEVPYEGTSQYSVELKEDESAVELMLRYCGEGKIRLDKVFFYKDFDVFHYSFLLSLNAIYFILLFLLKKHKRFILPFLVLILIVCNMIITEFIMSNSVYQVITLVSRRTVFFIIGMVPFLILAFLGWLLFNNYRVVCLFGLIPSWILTLIEVNYKNTRGDVFALSEMQSAADALRVADKIHFIFPYELIVTSVLLLLFCFSVITSERKDRSIKKKICYSVAAILIFIFGEYYIDHVETIIQRAGGEIHYTLIEKFYREYGYYTGMLRTYPERPTEPDGYNREKIHTLVETFPSYSTYKTLPNIIYVQVETLYDLSLACEPDWSTDPLDLLTSFQNTSTGFMLSPVTGGGTADVEYEVLTGYPFINTNGTPFNNQIRPAMPSIVSVFSDLGYETMAIHYNTGKCYNRNKAYSNLLFDKTVFLENMSYLPSDMLGSWLSDKYAVDLIISKFEERNLEKPFFAHIVTVQNHGDYPESYDVHGIIAGNSDRSPEQQRQLQSFLNMEKESCIQIKRLLDYFDKVNTPTVVVLWGDHCPWNNLFGIELDDSNIRTHLTPLMIYSNYGLETEDIGVVASYNLSPFVLSKLGIMPKDPYMRMMIERQIPNVCHGYEVYGPDHYRLISDWTEKEKEVWRDMWVLQYDRQFGEEYSKR